MERLVYIAVANKCIQYQHGSSPIVYIGTTKSGVWRIASSAADRAYEMFEVHGVWKLEFYVVTCHRRQNVKTWRKLERGLILIFRQKFGEVPHCNQHGKWMTWTDELDYFTEDRLRAVIETYSQPCT